MFRTKCCLLVLVGFAMLACSGTGGSTGASRDGGLGSAVASISISTDGGPLEVGLSQSFDAVVRDSTGAELIEAGVTWASSDNSIATIDTLGVAVAQSPGTTAITASSGTLTSAAVVLSVVPATPPGPSSEQLIAAALASGKIDAETALLYRVYTLFRDARLPAQYRGDDRRAGSGRAMEDAAEGFANLSAPTQTALQPFFIPPYYVGSWLQPQGQKAGTLAPRRSSADTLPIGPGWFFLDTQNGIVRIHWDGINHPKDFRKAQELAAEIDSTIWPKLSTAFAGRSPPSDANEPNNGGDGRLDVALVDIDISVTLPYEETPDWCKKPAFTLFKRIQGRTTMAHELMHAIQHAYDYQQKCGSYFWFQEATAYWAEDFVYPSEHTARDWADDFLGKPDLSLETVGGNHEHGAYLLPFFFTCYPSQCNTGSRPAYSPYVQLSWDNFENRGSDSLKAVNDALAAGPLAGGFEVAWPIFVRDNWARDWPPTNSYKTWGNLAETTAPPPPDGDVVELQLPPGTKDDKQTLDGINLPHLSSKYFYYEIKDPNVRTIAFYNGVTFKLDTTTVNPGDPQRQFDTYSWTPLNDAQKQGAKVQALMKYQGKDWESDPQDLTNLPVAVLCRDAIQERPEAVVVIVSNSQFQDTSATLQPQGLAPMIWYSNIGCWQWTGTASLTNNMGSVSETFNALNPTTWETLGGATLSHPYLQFHVTSGNIVWDASGTDSSGCTYSSSPTGGPLSTGGVNALQIPVFAIGGPFYRKISNISGFASTAPLMETITCPSDQHQVDRSQWLVGDSATFKNLRIEDDGTTIENSETQGTYNFNWSFRAVQQAQ